MASAFGIQISKLGFQFDRDQVDNLYHEFVKVADIKKEVNDEDLSNLAKIFARQAV
nr:hypothetical protein [Candidatus Brachybacter algidus]